MYCYLRFISLWGGGAGAPEPAAGARCSQKKATRNDGGRPVGMGESRVIGVHSFTWGLYSRDGTET